MRGHVHPAGRHRRRLAARAQGYRFFPPPDDRRWARSEAATDFTVAEVFGFERSFEAFDASLFDVAMRVFLG
jgi:hypothetical protein